MIADTLRGNLMALARGYARATGTTLAYVGKKFYGNGKFLKPFSLGKASISIDKYDALVKKFDEQWPEGAEWPYLGAAIIKRGKRKSIPN